MDYYDLCLAWNWQYDVDFTQVLDTACQENGISLLQITNDNLDWALTSLSTQQLFFQAFLDRASDADKRFLPLTQWACDQADVYINHFSFARRAWNKAEMQLKLENAGFDIPNTTILPSFLEQPELVPIDLSQIGEILVVKPAHGGGGQGVVPSVTQWEQVQSARQEFPSDQYLLQAYVKPTRLCNRPAWFRSIFCAGEVFTCWWDPLTHIYAPVTPGEQESLGLNALVELTKRMAEVCKLDLFSTEVALVEDGQFLIVDYVNDPIDLRLQSKAQEGVPDEIVTSIGRHLASYVLEKNAAILETV